MSGIALEDNKIRHTGQITVVEPQRGFWTAGQLRKWSEEAQAEKFKRPKVMEKPGLHRFRTSGRIAILAATRRACGH
jgi:hypothetical protein